jgi:hypothetical protein
MPVTAPRDFEPPGGLINYPKGRAVESFGWIDRDKLTVAGLIIELGNFFKAFESESSLYMAHTKLGFTVG